MADFTATPTSGVAPLNVQFTDTSSSNAQSWAWQFGDGNTSTQENTSHTYYTKGIYTVNLTVQGLCGEDTATKQINVDECILPNASFTYIYLRLQHHRHLYGYLYRESPEPDLAVR